MAKSLKSKQYEVESFHDAVELYYKNGWSDGLPVIPPTENRVAEFLDYVELDPDKIIGEVPERNRKISAEKLAINAVMAGCLPEYMPVLVAVIEAVTDPEYRFNHLASLGSPWPFIIVNGPITKQIALNSGTYVFGPGHRPNATIARAISLVLRNCAEAKVEGIQRGQWGNPMRWCGVVAENEETSWTPFHVMRGFKREQSVVTVVSSYPGSPVHCTAMVQHPEKMLDSVCHTLPTCSGGQWVLGAYSALVGPHYVELFEKEGWTKEAAHDYLIENTRASIARLKAVGSWGVRHENFTEDMLKIEPGDDKKYAYLFKDNGENEEYLARRTETEGRVRDIFMVVAGGNAGTRIGVVPPYTASNNPVSKVITTRR